ncbi:DUF2225 domain-containing protein [Defluviitalea saccharophila]|uniref:DUF2225 domain-containing protein n=1 Tax=Defluviitalea saccharophila TaxID=879970 RepID=A0ABZ2Y371_9FIRM
MSLEDYLYEKTVECPVCGNTFTVIAVKQKAYVVESRDTDFCVRYKEINPLLYDVWICQLCGYAAQKSTFPDISFKRAKLIQEYITPKWVARESEKIIDYDKAISRFKLALISAQISKAKASEVAGLCLKIAWTYRFMGETEKEKNFLTNALDKYLEAYAKERFPLENMDEPTVTYLIGELYRRLGNLEEAATWYSKVINTRAGSERVQKLAREQWHLVKEELKKNSAS